MASPNVKGAIVFFPTDDTFDNAPLPTRADDFNCFELRFRRYFDLYELIIEKL